MKVKVLIGILLLIAGFIYWYGFIYKGFYNHTHAAYDLYRLPLIEPYEIYSSDGQGWTTSISIDPGESAYKFPKVSFGGPSVDSVGLNKSLIFIYSSHENFTQGSSKGWFIYDTSQKKGKSFRDSDAFYSYLLGAYGINSIKFYDPGILFEEFRYTYRLPPEWPKDR